MTVRSYGVDPRNPKAKLNQITVSCLVAKEINTAQEKLEQIVLFNWISSMDMGTEFNQLSGEVPLNWFVKHSLNCLLSTKIGFLPDLKRILPPLFLQIPQKKCNE